MNSSRSRSEIFHKILTDKETGILATHKRNITTIILGLDLLEQVNESRNNKELVQIIRHSFERMVETISITNKSL